MIEYDTEMITEQELHDMAGKIFSVAEQDFEKIKSEKWYQTLFHAITLNQNGKEYAVKGICSLAKLQQLFMEIYVTFYKENHSYLDRIMNAVMENSEAIKKLYGVCVLNLEEQQPLSSLNEYDANILALFLGEYRNSEGEVPDEVKKYNRGVLKALNQSVPKGTLDNHQLDKLEEPKVVYRCFMEQCAVDGTIDSQEWTDKIYEDLRYFNLSDNSKSEIKELVKHEAEIAGVEYFITKYTKDNSEVVETDFEIDIEASIKSMAAQEKEISSPWDLMRLDIEFTELEACFTMAIINGALAKIDFVSDDEVKKDVANGKIKLDCLKGSVHRSLDNDDGFIHAFKICDTDDDEYKHYFLIATIDGYFFFINEGIAFIKYGAVTSVKQDRESLTISASKIKLYSENGTNEFDTNEIIILKSNENDGFLFALRKCIENIIEDCGGYVEPAEDKVEEIVEKYIKQIANSSSAVPYMIKDFEYNDDKEEKRLKNALSKYALKVREDEVIGFIDTSIFGNGKSGILFSKYGIAFDFAFEKIFAKYEEIELMSIEKGKRLVLYGSFSERKNDLGYPYISNIYFNLSALKECLEEIKCVI